MSATAYLDRTTCTSFTFPVPWGFVAGKAWGQPGGHPVLALHGWMDNAGSFDNLIPLLSNDLYVVAVDLPGHGQSSHRPKGVPLHYEDDLTTIKYVVDALNWEQFMILGHSNGGTLGLLFAASLPGKVKALVTIEGVGDNCEVPQTLMPPFMGEFLNNFFTPARRNKTKCFNWDVLIDKILRGHGVYDPLMTRECAEMIAKRGTAPVDGGYVFTHDPDLSKLTSVPHKDGLATNPIFLMMFSEDIYQQFFSTVSCPVLALFGDISLYTQELWKKRVGYLPQDKLQLLTMAGGHQLHMYNASVVSEPINTFLHNVNFSKL